MARRRRRRKRRNPPVFMANRRRRRTVKYRGRRRAVRSLRRKTLYYANPRRRRYRRNFMRGAPGIRSVAGDLGWSAAGFMTTKVVGNMVTPMIAGVVGDQPIVRIGVKLGVAYVSAWALSSFMGSRVFMPAMIGGSLEAIQDAIRTFIAPTFPMLAANYEPLQLYYEPRAQMQRLPARRGLGTYYDLGDGLSPDHDSVV